MSKTAIILAGGKGRRLQPYTISIPKPLVPIGNTPIIEILIRQLKYHGFQNIIIAVNHLSSLIKEFLKNGENWGVNISYSNEKDALGTMGPIKLLSNLPDNFLVLNGDILTDLNFSIFYNNHVSSKEIFSISSSTRTTKIEYGVLETSNNYLKSMKEKPSLNLEVSMGVYCVSKNILGYIPNDKYFGFDDLMELLLKEQIKVKVFKHSGYWLDIGRPEDLLKATEFIEKYGDKFYTESEKNND